MTLNTTDSSAGPLPKSDGPIFVADLVQLEAYLKTTSKRKLILGGQLTMVSLEALKAQSGFMAQPPRTASGGWFPRSRNPKKLNLMLEQEALEQLAKARKKPAFAVDAILKFGLKLKGPDEHCVICAIEASSNTQVLVLTFKKQELIGYLEYQLAHPSQNTYEADLHLLLERLSQTNIGATFHWSGPVSPPKAHSVQVVDSSFWGLAPALALSVSGKPSLVRQHGVAAGLVGAACVAYAVAVYVPYTSYAAAKESLRAESESLRGDTAFSADRLSVLRSRQAFFEKQKRSEARFGQFTEVLAAFAQQPNVSIKSAKLLPSKEASQGGRPSDFEIMVEVPSVQTEDTTLDQGKLLLQSLSAKTGGNLRLAATGGSFKEDTSPTGRALRSYRIQGDFKNVN